MAASWIHDTKDGNYWRVENIIRAGTMHQFDDATGEDMGWHISIQPVGFPTQFPLIGPYATQAAAQQVLDAAIANLGGAITPVV